jgi:hypothetical protein
VLKPFERDRCDQLTLTRYSLENGTNTYRLDIPHQHGPPLDIKPARGTDGYSTIIGRRRSPRRRVGNRETYSDDFSMVRASTALRRTLEKRLPVTEAKSFGIPARNPKIHATATSKPATAAGSGLA